MGKFYGYRAEVHLEPGRVFPWVADLYDFRGTIVANNLTASSRRGCLRRARRAARHHRRLGTVWI